MPSGELGRRSGEAAPSSSRPPAAACVRTRPSDPAAVGRERGHRRQLVRRRRRRSSFQPSHWPRALRARQLQGRAVAWGRRGAEPDLRADPPPKRNMRVHRMSLDVARRGRRRSRSGCFRAPAWWATQMWWAARRGGAPPPLPPCAGGAGLRFCSRLRSALPPGHAPPPHRVTADRPNASPTAGRRPTPRPGQGANPLKETG
mmetsp:Transcript_9579/g.31851  ORF Transcript_9579/g.31851 Transcript_9579/m.31851 type:complete len:202 (-) Transcript_9579:113-718(-)